jgi:hypothetical protein
MNQEDSPSISTFIRKVSFNFIIHNLTLNQKFSSLIIYTLVVLLKYNQEVYDELMLAFDALPLAALLVCEELGSFLCCHGGIGPGLRTVSESSS